MQLFGLFFDYIGFRLENYDYCYFPLGTEPEKAVKKISKTVTGLICCLVRSYCTELNRWKSEGTTPGGSLDVMKYITLTI